MSYFQVLPLTVPLFYLTVSNALQCPKGYVQGTDDLDWAYCFTYFNEDSSWQDADRRCNAITGIYNELDTLPGYLASIDDKGVNDVVQLHACNDSGIAGYPRGFWIGMSKGIKSGEWTWSDTNAATWTNWKTESRPTADVPNMSRMFFYNDYVYKDAWSYQHADFDEGID